MDPRGPQQGLRSWVVIALALAVSLAPVSIQTATLALSHSVLTTLLVAGVLACLFILGGMRYQAYVYGSLDAVPGASIVGLVVSVLLYHALALPMAFILYAKFLAPAGSH